MRRLTKDRAAAAALFLLSLALYVGTLAPTVATIFDDSLEFQFVLPTLGIAHPTGYPLYTIFGWLFVHSIPLGDAAYRANLFSALGAATAVAFLYLAAVEAIGWRPAAVAGAVALALSPVFWSQATIAEVYGWQAGLTALWLWLALRWGKGKDDSLIPLALVTGAMLAHHRMTVLLLPALAYWLWANRRKIRRPLEATVAGLVPLLSYAYIPIRGMSVTSLDGTYRNTWSGFWRWVMASSYGTFLRENPFHVHYTPGYFFHLWLKQFGPVGLAAGVLGLVLLWKDRKTWAFLILALLANVAFAMTYRVADVDVFFIPSFLLFAMFVAGGVAVLNLPTPRFRTAGAALAILFLLQPFFIAHRDWRRMDRSGSWGVYDYATDVLSQPMPEGSKIVGLLGEQTLIRYMQCCRGMRKDIVPLAQDDPARRLALVEGLVRRGETVYLTRKLEGAPERFSLGSSGPLIRVWPPGEARYPAPEYPADEQVAPGILLTGYDEAVRRTHTGPVVRITLYWRVGKAQRDDLKVSARLLSGDRPVVSVDDWPVHRAYPTRYWRPGETIADDYDLKLPAPGTFTPLVILYRSKDVKEVGRVELAPVDVR